MIISVSRRTDVPAFYSRWFVSRLKEGFADVVNPFNPSQVRRVDLQPESVEAIIFWTRNPRPLFKYLPQIDDMGYKYYFLYTITGYPEELEPNLPSLERALETFRALSARLKMGQTVWRYDPIVITSITPPLFHLENFERIASGLKGVVDRVVISFVDSYRKTERRMKKLFDERKIAWQTRGQDILQELELASRLKQTAAKYGISIQACAEELDLASAGINCGRCVDTGLLNRLFGLNLPYKKDTFQRKSCLCAGSVDIGAYNTCGYRCVYCYANSSFESSARNMREFDWNSPSMSGNVNKEVAR